MAARFTRVAGYDSDRRARRSRLGTDQARLRARLPDGTALPGKSLRGEGHPDRGIGPDAAGTARLRRAGAARASPGGREMTRGRAGSVLLAALLLALAVALGIAVGGVRLSFSDLLSGRGPAGET